VKLGLLQGPCGTLTTGKRKQLPLTNPKLVVAHKK
jgi:hypothetical protein